MERLIGPLLETTLLDKVGRLVGVLSRKSSALGLLIPRLVPTSEGVEDLVLLRRLSRR